MTKTMASVKKTCFILVTVCMFSGFPITTGQTGVNIGICQDGEIVSRQIVIQQEHEPGVRSMRCYCTVKVNGGIDVRGSFNFSRTERYCMESLEIRYDVYTYQRCSFSDTYYADTLGFELHHGQQILMNYTYQQNKVSISTGTLSVVVESVQGSSMLVRCNKGFGVINKGLTTSRPEHPTVKTEPEGLNLKLVGVISGASFVVGTAAVVTAIAVRGSKRAERYRRNDEDDKERRRY